MKRYVRQLSMVLLLAVVLSGVSLSVSMTQAQGTIEYEHNYLVALYNSTDGPNWTNKWEDLYSDHCTWYGVTCDEEFRYVRWLDLSNNGLNGSIPPELGYLTGLRALYLHNNQLAGEIPAALGNLSSSHFYWLHLSDNQLMGEIPAELSNLSSLTGVNLSNNQLSGPIPAELVELHYLLQLSLNNNDESLCISTPELQEFLQNRLYEGPSELCYTPPTADAGGPYEGYEGSVITFDASASSDLDGDVLQYRWDFENDGTWTDWSTTPTADHTWLDNWTGTAKVEVTDGTETASATADVTIYNVAPTATFLILIRALSGEILQGESATLFFIDQVDPSAVDTEAGFLYWYDCDGGEFEVIDGSSPSFDCTYPGPGTFTARGRIKDKDAGFTEYPIEVTVLTPVEGIEDLVDTVEAFDLAKGLENSLDAKLEAAKRALEDSNENNDVSAINRLQAFINQVEAQRDKGITDEQADFLIQADQQIIDSIVGD